ncbi:hypothetical protein INT47_006742 [Mucor saturninus]|uniref:Uncharacterized protein n=1 Tax=Mucor saturninus TaxID=64648 RepID=A0A8H7QPA0_9FUNG|nr:hypothetical protein INT47_006742 [Mucor saturninus]
MEPVNDGRAPDNNKTIFGSQKKTKVELSDGEVRTQRTVNVEVDDSKSSTEDDFDLYFDQIDKNPYGELAVNSDMQESLEVFEKHDEVILVALGEMFGTVNRNMTVSQSKPDKNKEIEAILREIEVEDKWMNGTDILKIPKRTVAESQYKQNAASFNLVSQQVNDGLVYTSNVKTMAEKKLVVTEASAMIRGFVWRILSSVTDVDCTPQFKDRDTA